MPCNCTYNKLLKLFPITAIRHAKNCPEKFIKHNYMADKIEQLVSSKDIKAKDIVNKINELIDYVNNKRK